MLKFQMWRNVTSSILQSSFQIFIGAFARLASIVLQNANVHRLKRRAGDDKKNVPSNAVQPIETLLHSIATLLYLPVPPVAFALDLYLLSAIVAFVPAFSGMKRRW
ncbi:hypothetical protein ACFQUU_01920 [Herbaspirillum sp. GCM10030257]|uniref:hypothetical protein n=1 Tax=Herbaspirillum sp. GCM10030257 TaxID=3273393 RepID=UPI003619C258